MRLPFNGSYPTTCDFACHKAKGGDVAKYAGHDWSMAVGTPLYAVEAGTVTTHKDQYGALWVKLVSSDGKRQWQYVHLSRYGSTGSVRSGTLVGYSGNTGYTWGAHLHFACIENGVRKDPIPVLNVSVPDAGIRKGIYIQYLKDTRVRKGNGLKYAINTTARAGSVWWIKDGARNTDGYEWWDVQAVDQETGEKLNGTGWSALRLLGGDYWVKKVSKPSPPPVDPCQDCKDDLGVCTKKLTTCTGELKNCQGKLTQIQDVLEGAGDALKVSKGDDVVSWVQNVVTFAQGTIQTLQEDLKQARLSVVENLEAGDLFALAFRKLFSRASDGDGTEGDTQGT